LRLQKQAEFLQYYNSGTPEWNRTTARGSGEIKNNFFILFEKVGNAHSMRRSLLLAIA
jgi:hypothetical protein